MSTDADEARAVVEVADEDGATVGAVEVALGLGVCLALPVEEQAPTTITVTASALTEANCRRIGEIVKREGWATADG